MFINILESKRKNQQGIENKPKFARFSEQNDAVLFFKELGLAKFSVIKILCFVIQKIIRFISTEKPVLFFPPSLLPAINLEHPLQLVLPHVPTTGQCLRQYLWPGGGHGDNSKC